VFEKFGYSSVRVCNWRVYVELVCANVYVRKTHFLVWGSELVVFCKFGCSVLWNLAREKVVVISTVCVCVCEEDTFFGVGK
jgi:hypothetical protein